MTKIALVDVDQVLADTWGALVSTCAPSLQETRWKTWGLFYEMLPSERKKAKELMSDPEFWLSAPVMPGAKDGLKAIRAAGFEVVALTAPWTSCKGWEWARRKWLQRHGIRIPPEAVIITSQKHLVNGDIFIEDKTENINSWADHHINSTPILFDQTHNQGKHHENVVRMLGWTDIYNVLRVHHERRRALTATKKPNGRARAVRV